ncbi:hypothetical protein GCM10011390_29050 [Aureimonas endophytica]|uniref:Uncharacterized protein n=1 Tax=Aureimonas endophytica TaxID=2027858 RepID=A0A917E646_9HYPH|nr:hypothetical protein GCM10011390_29050 [Aureimonas endophytica]
MAAAAAEIQHLAEPGPRDPRLDPVKVGARRMHRARHIGRRPRPELRLDDASMIPCHRFILSLRCLFVSWREASDKNVVILV